VDCTKNAAHPLLAICGLELVSVVACAAPPVLDVNTSWMESVALVTVLFDASFTQTLIVDCDAPFAGIGFGEAVATRWVAVPKPTNEIVVAAGVSPSDEAVAVQASATASPIVNFTVVPLDEVLVVVGFPPPPTGVVLVTVAAQRVAVLGWVIVKVTAVGPKTGLPPASWTWTVTSQVEPGDALVVGVLLQVLPAITSFAAGPEALTVAVADPEARPGTDAVTVQLPGAPLVVRVVLALLDPAPMVAVLGETVQMPELSTLNVTVSAV